MAQRQFRSDDTSKWVYGYGDGSDGAYAPSTGTDAPIDSACTGTSGATSLSATNASFAAGQVILIHQTKDVGGAGASAGKWELNKIDSYTAGTITTKLPLCNTYVSGAQVLVIKQYSSILIDSGVTLTGKSWNGTVGGIIAWLCKGTTEIKGTVTVSGTNGAVATGYVNGDSEELPTSGGGFRGGDGTGFGSGSTAGGQQGEGIAGGLIAGTGAKSANAGGGSRAENTGDTTRAGGAGGGNGAAGTSGTMDGSQGSAGVAGDAAGNAGLTTMVFGGGGGGGGSRVGSGENTGSAGTGGGIIFIISRNVTITGYAKTNGGNGGTTTYASGGGGAGGSILIKGKIIVLGTNLATASAGTSGGMGGAGGVGRIHVDYLASITGTTSPTLDSRQDFSLENAGGAFLYHIL